MFKAKDIVLDNFTWNLLFLVLFSIYVYLQSAFQVLSLSLKGTEQLISLCKTKLRRQFQTPETRFRHKKSVLCSFVSKEIRPMLKHNYAAKRGLVLKHDFS